MRRMAVAGLLVVTLLLGGCGQGAGADPDGSTPLSAAANRVDREMRSSWAASFAGTELDTRNDRLIVYRKPDAGLEAAVRTKLDGVDVEFRDAPYSLSELQPVADRVNADRAYWADRKIVVRWAVPRADGTAVNVVVRTDDVAAAGTAFAQRYDNKVIVSTPTTTGIVPA
nr:hypothetical protein [uncultured Actinoplanes sp.]